MHLSPVIKVVFNSVFQCVAGVLQAHTHTHNTPTHTSTHSHSHTHTNVAVCLISLAFVTGNNSLEPLLEGLFAQIHNHVS